MDKVAEYVYAVMCYDPWIDCHFLDVVFKNLEDAEKYKAKRDSEEDNEFLVTIEKVSLV